MASYLIFLSPLLFLTLCSTASANSTCQFSIPNNDTLFKKLSKHFDKHSNTIVIEYTIRLNNGSGEFNLYKGSNSNSFEPWKWYRTQGAGNSHVLLTYDFYFGILKSILALGTRQYVINIDVQPLSCVESENFDLFIRDILLQDFKISGNSTYRAYPKADDVDVCTARIDETNDGRGELVFRCCSYDSEKKIFCDDKSVNIWGYALNIVVIVISVFLVCCFLWVVQREHEKEIYCYSPPDGSTFEVQIVKKETNKTKKYILLPPETLKRKEKFKELIQAAKDKNYTVYVQRVYFTVSKHQLYSKLDDVKSLRELLKTLFMKSKHTDSTESLTSKIEAKKSKHTDSTESLTSKIEAKISECPDRVKQCVKNFVTMAILTLPSLLFLCTMITDRFWYQKLIEAYIERGLQGPFYFQWSKIITVQRALVVCLIVWFSFGFVLYTVFGDRMRRAIKNFMRKIKTLYNHDETKSDDTQSRNPDETIATVPHQIASSNKDKNKNKCFGAKLCNRVKPEGDEKSLWLILTLFFCIPFFLFLFLGAHFILNLLVMMIFTVIVQSDIFSIFVQAILTFLIYVEVYYKDYHKRHNALKTVLLNLLKDEGVYTSKSNGVSKITDNLMKTKFANRKIEKDTPPAKVATKNTTISVQDGNLILELNAPVLFLNTYDVRSISHTFLFHCCQMDCEGAPKKLNITKISLLLTATVTFIALVFLIVKAFGDIYYISPSNSFIFSFVTSLAPLVLKYFNSNLSSEKMVQENDRRFQKEIRKKIKAFSEKLTIADMPEMSFLKGNETGSGGDKDRNTGQEACVSRTVPVIQGGGGANKETQPKELATPKLDQPDNAESHVGVGISEIQLYQAEEEVKTSNVQGKTIKDTISSNPGNDVKINLDDPDCTNI